MDRLTILQAQPDDLLSIQKIGKETFFETFAVSNTEEDMESYLEDSFNAERLASELANPNSLFFLVRDEYVPVAYLKLNFSDAQTDLKETDSVEIERIYVKKAYHGQKVGQLLYDKALEIARIYSKSSIWLGVWEKNPRAIRFYKKNGFEAFDKHIFLMGIDEQTDILMRKMLIG